MKRYEIWQARLSTVKDGRIRSSCCPVVIVSADVVNSCSSAVTIVPLTTRPDRMHQMAHGAILMSGLRNASVALCDKISMLDKDCLTCYIGYVSDPDDCAALEYALSVQLGMAA